MVRMFSLAVAVATSIGFSLVAAAAENVDSTRRAEQYYVAAGKTYNMHAHDHARMLGKYAAAANEPVPRDVVQEHADGIATNVEHARNSFAKLATAAKGDPTIKQQLAEIEKRLDQVTGQVARLKTESNDEAVDSQLLAKETAQITSDLKATHMAGKEIDNALAQQAESRDAFYNRNSPSYYFTGEGHFID